MRSSHERHLRVISTIDDDILSRTDKKRANFLEQKQRRRARLYRTVIGAASGVLAASILLIVLLPLLGGSVPVYRGMSVSGAPTVAAHRDGGDVLYRTHKSETLFVGGNEERTGNEGNNGNHYGNENGNGNGNGNGQGGNDLSPIGNTYYATPGEDVLIYIHIDNPANFEILSFTLNGVKYSSYMFEPGSTMQTIILKVNVGEAEGFREYTIDAIKYVDGTAIKDVRMKGERTIRVGVAAEGNNLGTGIELAASSYTGLSFDIEICDVLGILTDGSVPVLAKLYRNDELIRTERVTLNDGIAAVAFSELAPGAAYRLDVTATYDADDGEGTVERVLKSTACETPHAFTLKHTVKLSPRYSVFSNSVPAESEDELIKYPIWDLAAPVLCAELLCEDDRFTVVSAKQTRDGVTRAAADLSAIPVGRGESTVSVTYTFDGEEYTSVLSLSDVLSEAELCKLYYIAEPYNKLQHDGIDLGCFESYTLVGNWEEAKIALGSAWDEEAFTKYPHFKTNLERPEVYIPVYALTNGYLWNNDLYCTDLQTPGMADLLNSATFNYRLTEDRADLNSSEGVYVEAGTFLGLYRISSWGALSGCSDNENAMHVSYDSLFLGDTRPMRYLPALHASDGVGKVTTSPTCTTAGERFYQCTDRGCGAVLHTEILPPLGHEVDEDAWQTDGVSHYNVCTRTGCGEHLNTVSCTFELIPVDSEQHAVCCTVCGGVKAGTQGEHSFAGGETVVKEPTCTAVGELHRECTTCGQSITVDIPMTAHTYDEEQPVAVDGTHHAVLCTVSDAEKPDSRVSCTFGEAVITPPSETDCTPGKSTRTCAACENTSVQITEPSAFSHRLSNAVYDKSAKTVTWTCTVCDATYTVSGVTAANTFGPEDPVGPSNCTPPNDLDWETRINDDADCYIECVATQPDSGTYYYGGPLQNMSEHDIVYVSFDVKLPSNELRSDANISIKSASDSWFGDCINILPDGSIALRNAGTVLAPVGTVNTDTFTNVTFKYVAETGEFTYWINGKETVTAVTSPQHVGQTIWYMNFYIYGAEMGCCLCLDNITLAHGAQADVQISYSTAKSAHPDGTVTQ